MWNGLTTIAPAANILLVEASSASEIALMAAVDYARNYSAVVNGVPSSVVAVSMSWGGNEGSGETVDDAHFTTPAGHTGVTFFASSGDSNTIGYPAISSHVVSVGGTALSVDNAGNYLGESADCRRRGPQSIYWPTQLPKQPGDAVSRRCQPPPGRCRP